MKKLLLFYLLFGTLMYVFPQVGINTEEPNELTDLDIRNAADNRGASIPRGIMIPRLSEAERDMIDVSNAELANSLLIYNTDQDCYNYFNRTENQWKSLCGEYGRSEVADVNCDSVKIMGEYTEGQSLDTSNYLEVPVIVSKAGTYNISAVSDPANGYYFTNSGEFLTPGSVKLRIQGLGVPVTGGTDNIILTINGTSYCTLTNDVNANTITAEYSIDCNTPGPEGINGSYSAGEALTSQNFVYVTITSPVSSFGATYAISTNTVNGYSFSGVGVISQAIQTVPLYATGTPVNSQTDTFTVTTNSSTGSTTCTFDVKVAARAITIVGLGENDTYYLGTQSNGMNRLLRNPDLFGTSQLATSPVAGFNILTPGTGNLKNIAEIISASNPDIIIIQYNWINEGGAYEPQRQALADFVNNNNGVLILCSDGNPTRGGRVADIANRIFGTSSISFVANDDANTWPFATPNTYSSAILQGPFMDLSNLHMSRDAGENFTMTGLPADASVIAWQSDTNQTNVRAFMHNTKGLVVIGDGGPFASALNNTDPYNYPLKIELNDGYFYPIENRWSTPYGYNSFLFCNIMDWAIKYVQQNKAP